MRKIERTGQFRRDYKREARGQHRTSLDADLVRIPVALTDDQPLEPRHHDHALSGDWKDHRDCHVKPDLVLIYQKLDAATLRLVRLGSHSELGFLRRSSGNARYRSPSLRSRKRQASARFTSAPDQPLPGTGPSRVPGPASSR